MQIVERSNPSSARFLRDVCGLASRLVRHPQDVEDTAGAILIRDAAASHFDLVNFAGAQHVFINPNATEDGRCFGRPLAYDAAGVRESWSGTQVSLARVVDEAGRR